MENKGQIDIFVLIIISTLGILVLVFFIVFIVALYQKRILAHKALLITNENKHQKKLLDASLEIAEKERIKIATNLHDDIGITLNVLKINLNRAKKNINRPEIFEAILADGFKNIDDSIDTIRAIYNDIMPPTLMKLGFVKGIKELCNQLSNTGAIKIAFSTQQEEIIFDQKIQVQLYRLTKEIVNNTIKHGKPANMQVCINHQENNLILSLLHDGATITKNMILQFAETSTGLGLKSILTRAQLINAELDFIELENGTAQVLIKTPI